MRPPIAAGKLQIVDEDTLAFTLKTPDRTGSRTCFSRLWSSLLDHFGIKV